MRRTAALLLAGLLAGPAGAVDVATATAAAGAQARIAEARALLSEAEAALSQAGGRRSRLQALGQGIQAHEAALAALRAGLRLMATEDRRLIEGLNAERGHYQLLLGALQSLARAPRSALLVYPDGPLKAARAVGLLAEVVPELERATSRLTARLEGLRRLRDRQETARREAKAALAALQALRGESLRAKRNAPDAPSRETVIAQAALAAESARSLDALALALEATLPVDTGAAQFVDQRGKLPLPVAGRIAGVFGGVDPWGRTGQGLTLSAPAYAQVSAPWDGTVRFAAPITDMGTVVILEPQEGWLMVFAGLAYSGRRAGETVLAGEPIGDLGGPLPSSEEFLLEASGEAGPIPTEKLYVEIRRADVAIDPAPWFVTTGK